MNFVTDDRPLELRMRDATLSYKDGHNAETDQLRALIALLFEARDCILAGNWNNNRYQLSLRSCDQRLARYADQLASSRVQQLFAHTSGDRVSYETVKQIVADLVKLSGIFSGRRRSRLVLAAEHYAVIIPASGKFKSLHDETQELLKPVHSEWQPKPRRAPVWGVSWARAAFSRIRT